MWKWPRVKMLESTPARGRTNQTFTGVFATVYGVAHGFYFLETLAMAIIDDRPLVGVKILSLDVGSFFLSKGQLFLKAHTDLVIDLQRGVNVLFDQGCVVQPVAIDIFIRSNID